MKIYVPKQYSRDFDANEKRLTTFMNIVKYLSLIIFILMSLISYLSVKPFHFFWTYFNFM